jgi:hypothetical protein
MAVWPSDRPLSGVNERGSPRVHQIMTAAVVLLVAGLSIAGYVLRQRRSRRATLREAGRVVIASNLAASRRR